MAQDDSLLRALADLDGALDQNIARVNQMKRRIAQIRREREAGKSYREIVESQESPLVVQLITTNLQALEETGGRVRRMEARALHDEGMTMEQIAVKFGVTRQRISGLLNDQRADRR